MILKTVEFIFSYFAFFMEILYILQCEKWFSLISKKIKNIVTMV